MSIEIDDPETIALIEAHMQTGRFKTIDDLIHCAFANFFQPIEPTPPEAEKPISICTNRPDGVA